MPRVIVTTSHSWTDVGMTREALDAAHLQLGPYTLIYAGTDRLLGATAMPTEHHPPYCFDPDATAAARWAEITKSNKAMIRAGADLCLAFIGQCTSSHCPHIEIHPSHGATDCIHRAQLARIPVRRYWTPWLRDWGQLAV